MLVVSPISGTTISVPYPMKIIVQCLPVASEIFPGHQAQRIAQKFPDTENYATVVALIARRLKILTVRAAGAFVNDVANAADQAKQHDHCNDRFDKIRVDSLWFASISCVCCPSFMLARISAKPFRQSILTFDKAVPTSAKTRPRCAGASVSSSHW